MDDAIAIARELAWPLGLLLAWLIGELGHRWSGLPRITLYALVGFVLAPAQIGLLPQSTPDAVVLLANIGFGLILFETGHRINLKWLRNNPWLGASGLLESGLTFGVVYLLGRWFGLSPTITALLAALAMATSPAAVLRVINEQSSSGQVTERLLHLAALNCVLAVFTFKIVVGLVVFGTSGNIWHAVYSSAIILLASVFLGAVFGHAVPALLRATDRTVQDSTLAFALAVIALVMLTHALKLSPLLATLTFGLIARDRRIVLNRSQRGFGILGEVLTLLLFVFVSATLSWEQVLAGMGMGLTLVVGRALAKTVGITALARASGITWRKGLLTSLGMAPLSVFVILLIEQTRISGVDLMAQLSPLAAAALVLEILGPVLTQFALRWAHEARDGRED
ncbi:MAG: cation:proton antiporter [Gammaproteobacteria bacterium]|nr:cation:proton antiporter [Gammaproteobacteria bacterium]